VTDNVGSPSISLVAHSAGGLIARNYVKQYDPTNRVKKVIMTGVANYGTKLDSTGTDYDVGSTFLAGLNAGDVSKTGVDYWSFTTSVDNIVFPYENQQLPRTAGTTSTSLSYPYVKHPIPGVLPDPQVTNLIIQEQCPWALIPHVGMTGTAPVQNAIAQALQGRRTITVPC
jgi:triacylglycerol esterase/lipase EstA (alpha/beta hydrolase family)